MHYCFKLELLTAGLGTLANVVTSLATLNEHSTSDHSSSTPVNRTYGHINIPKVILSNGITPSKQEDVYAHANNIREKQSLISKAFDTLAKAVTNQKSSASADGVSFSTSFVFNAFYQCFKLIF